MSDLKKFLKDGKVTKEEADAIVAALGANPTSADADLVETELVKAGISEEDLEALMTRVREKTNRD